MIISPVILRILHPFILESQTSYFLELSTQLFLESQTILFLECSFQKNLLLLLNLFHSELISIVYMILSSIIKLFLK